MAGLRGLDGVDREETDCVGEIAVCDCSDVCGDCGVAVSGSVFGCCPSAEDSSLTMLPLIRYTTLTNT